MKNYDYIIVGQGIAGTSLAYLLLKNKKNILVMDASESLSASSIAAGMFNPVVFKRLVKSWKADELLAFAKTFYADAEEVLGEKLFFEKPIVKLFSEEQEKELWRKKISSETGIYLSEITEKVFFENTIQNNLGYAEVKHSGNIDLLLFLQLFQKKMLPENNFLAEKMQYELLKISDEQVSYKNVSAKKIIFCEGAKSVDNPYFKWLPFKLTKGEILTVRIKNFNTEKIVNKGVFILPIGNEIFKVGATYEWSDLTNVPTEKGKTELIQKLEKILKVPYQIINHEAGIRPTVLDRRPLIGTHPEHPTLCIFNGMGTKGALMAPYFANHFINYLENNFPLDAEVNIARFSA
ncbi:MAG TPA: FAD-dependent oxidoreductase [Bacteroidia bacterium]|nr:FAD-dependent oxidoreductase [Bacteroidia bacterium]